MVVHIFHNPAIGVYLTLMNTLTDQALSFPSLFKVRLGKRPGQSEPVF